MSEHIIAFTGKQRYEIIKIVCESMPDKQWCLQARINWAYWLPRLEIVLSEKGGQ